MIKQNGHMYRVHIFEDLNCQKHMSNKTELVAHLVLVIRSKLNQLYTLQKYLSSLMTYFSDCNYHTMKVQDTAKYDAAIEGTITRKEVEGGIGPLDGFSFDQTHEIRIR